MEYILYFDYAAIVIYFVMFINMCYKKTIRTRSADLFTALLFSSLWSNLFDISGTLMLDNASSVPLVLNYIINILYFATFNIIAPIFLIYILVTTGVLTHRNKKAEAIIFIPYMISASLIVTTPLTGWVFRFGEDLTYEHGSMFIFLYVIAEMYLLSAFIITVIHRKKLSKDKAVSSFCFFGGSIMAVFIQIFIPEIIITQFTAAVTILIIYMTLQNPEDYFDRNTGTFNRRAFMEIFGEKAREDKSIDIVALKIFDMDYLSHTLGSDSADEILKNAIAGLYALRGKAMFFKISHTKYAFLCDREENIFDHLPEEIKKLFSKPFSHGGLSITLSAPTCCISCPEIVTCVDEVFSMIDYYLEVKVKDGQENVMWGEKQVLERHNREEKLLNAMRRALLSDGFYVVYQPIYSVAEGGFSEAEALVRLSDTDGLGFVSPEEFIPLAEKNGLITQIGELVVKKVCGFLSKEKPVFIKRVNINLSVVQCMQGDLHDKLISVIDEYGIDRNLIAFEITETSAAYSEDVLKNNMERFISSGMDFAMDDYGSGFSGTGYLIDYPFSAVKLDKHIVWEAFKSDKAMSVLRNTVKMIKEMNMIIVAEGVETEEQSRALIGMGCDLLQGYLYSRPVTSDMLPSVQKDI